MENLEDKYPNLKKYLRFLTPDNIGQRTYIIEKSGNKEILNEWINYWIEKDYILSSKIIVKLKNIPEEIKSEYKQKLISKILDEPDSLSKQKNLVIVYLYLEEFENIEKLFKYFKWIQCISGDIYIKEEKTKIESKEWIKYNDIKQTKSPLELQKLIDKIISQSHIYDEFIYKYKKRELIKLQQLCNIESNTKLKKIKGTAIKTLKEIRELGTFGKETLYIGTIFTYVINYLLKDSNYKLIFELIYLIEKVDLFICLRPKTLTRLDKTPFTIVDDIIQKTVNSMLNKNKYAYAFLFLKKIKVKDYFKYIPKKESEIKYIELIDKYNSYIIIRSRTDIMNIKKELYVKSMYNGTNYEECLISWLEYIKTNTGRLEKRSTILTIYELINLNIDNLSNENVISKLNDSVEENINNEAIIKMQISVIEKIICLNFSIEEKVEKIKKLGKTNQFSEKIKYKEDNNLLYHNLKRINIKNCFIDLIESSKKEDLENILFLYMNTCLKYDLSLEKLIMQLNNKGYKNIYEYINKHDFFGKFMIKQESALYYKFKILNVKTDNLAQILKSTLSKTELNSKNILKIKVINYPKNNNGIIVEKIEEIEKLDEINYLELIEAQIELLKKLNNKRIENLKKDENNPFEFEKITKIHFDIQNKAKNIRDIINKQGEKQVNGTSYNYKQYFTQEISQIYKNIFEENKIDIYNIVFSYMNTIARYFLDFNDFVEMLVEKINENKEQIVDISIYFKNYNIICQEIVENKIINPIQINAKNLVTEETNEKNLYYYKFGIKEYDTYKKQIKVKEVVQVNDLPRNTEQYTKIVDLLNKYANNPENKEELFCKIKKIEKLPELQNSYYTVPNKHFERYETIYKIIVVKELEKGLKNLEEFIKVLGENNYWKYNNYITDDKVILTEENDDENRIKDIFIKQARKSDFETVMICYNNTFIKEILPLDILFDKMFKFNIFQSWEINENNIINLEKYNLEINAIYINEQEHSNNLITVKSIENQAMLNIKLDKELPYIKEKTTFLKLLIKKYDLKNNIIYCNIKYSKFLKNQKYKYCIKYLYEVDRILKNNLDINYIYEYIKKPKILAENGFYYKTLKNYYFNRDFGVEECEDIIKLLLERYKNIFYKRITKYIKNSLDTGKINKDNLYKAIFIYDKTILRHIFLLNEYIKYFKEIINQNEVDLDLYIKIKTQIREYSSLYTIYIPRYLQMQKAILLTPKKLKIETEKYYLAKIYKYDENEDVIIYNYLSNLTPREAKILEKISCNPKSEKDIINIMDNQINLIKEITPNIVKQMLAEKKNIFGFIKRYENTEKKIIKNIKKLCLGNFESRKKIIKTEMKKMLIRFGKNELNYVIAYYMDTCIKYLLTLSDFLDLIIECYPDKFAQEQGIFNISDDFAFYKMPIDSVQDNIVKNIQISNIDKIIVNTSLLNNNKDITKGRMCINKYDKNKRVLIVEKIYFKE